MTDESRPLDAREEAVLKSVIRQHIETGEPIGSKSVARAPRLDLSPATVRNIMVELEHHGLLTQPHTSAGRLPTAQAYRLYVDRLIRKGRISKVQTDSIREAMSGRRGEVAELLGEASRQLSRFSNQIGVVLAPDVSRIVVEKLEFVRLDGGRVVAILVGRSGVVHNRILELGEPLSQSELDSIGRHLTEEYGGRTIPETRRLLEARLAEERAAYDRMMAAGLDLGRRSLAGEIGSTAVFVDGASNLLDRPEFADPAKMRSVLHALERKRTLIQLLGRVMDQPGVQVVIGEDQPSPDLSLVASTYGSEGRVMGTVGIVGPTRMEYARAIALVDHVAQVLTHYLAPGDLTQEEEDPRLTG